jgi:cytoskeletal protein CcmA (bactofilin family)
MALLGKDWETLEGGRPAPAAPAGGPGADAEAGAMTAFLGRGSKLTGKVTLSGPGRIDGHLEGEISATDALVIGEHATINARITGSSIVIHGTVNGDITARTRLEVRAPGKVTGNIDTKCLVIQEGAVFEGRCTMGGTDAPKVGHDKKAPAHQRAEKPTESAVPPPLS